LLDELIKEGATWEDFQKELDQVKDNSIDKNIDDFKVFVDRIVKKLGYDISAAKAECGELYNVLAQLVVSGEKLGVAFKKLFKEYEDKDPQKVLEDLISGIKVTPNESKDGKNATLVTWSDVKESFGSLDNFCKEAKKIGDSDTILIGTEKFNIGLAAEGSDYGKIMPILNLVQEILDLIKKFSDIEWGKIKDEFEDFGNFIYFDDKVEFDPKKYKRPEIYFGFIHDQYIVPQILGLKNNNKKEKKEEEVKQQNKEEKKIDNEKLKPKKINKKKVVKNLDDIMTKLNLKYIEPPKKEKIVEPLPQEEEVVEEEDNSKDKNKKGKDANAKGKNAKDDPKNKANKAGKK